jgi:ribose transport system ATP-binding protein
MSSTSSSPPVILQMTGIHKRFGATLALGGVDLTVRPGEVLALVGENGAGKSTLMKVLSGAHSPDAGTMTLLGQPYHPRSPLDARRAGVGMIYQELSLAPDLSVMENILLGMEPTRLAGLLVNFSDVRSRALAALREVMGDDRLPNLSAPARSLSVAQQQMVEIARAVAVGCKVLVLDEPTSSLTSADIARLFSLVRRLRSRGLGIVYISHFLEELTTLCDRYTVLRDGCSVGSGDIASVTHPQLISLMVGRDVKDLYPRSPRPPPSPDNLLLEISNLAGARGPRSASLKLHKGEVVGIAGLVGAGRTELLRSLFGLDRVRSGSIRIQHITGPRSPHARWQQGVGMVSEDRKTEGLALTLSIAENTVLPTLGLLTSPSSQRHAASRWITSLGIKCRHPAQGVGELSGGNQQKVAIARLLQHDSDLLLLDEPTRGIDVGAKATIYQTIDQLASKGKAVLLVSSYLPELLGICDRIAVMTRGHLFPAIPAHETNEHHIMSLATSTNPNLAIGEHA